MTTDRKIAANLARDLYAGKIDFNKFCLNYPENSGDGDIAELYDLIEHQPKSGGLLGVDNSTHLLHIAEINRFINKLENEAGFPMNIFVNWFAYNDLLFKRKLVYSTGFDLKIKIFEIESNNVKVNELLADKYFGDFYYQTNTGIFLRKLRSKRSWPRTRLVYLDLFKVELIDKLKTRSSYLDWTVKSIDDMTYEIDTKREKRIINVP
jgi:hypothetical protein